MTTFADPQSEIRERIRRVKASIQSPQGVGGTGVRTVPNISNQTHPTPDMGGSAHQSQSVSQSSTSSLNPIRQRIQAVKSRLSSTVSPHPTDQNTPQTPLETPAQATNKPGIIESALTMAGVSNPVVPRLGKALVRGWGQAVESGAGLAEMGAGMIENINVAPTTFGPGAPSPTTPLGKNVVSDSMRAYGDFVRPIGGYASKVAYPKEQGLATWSPENIIDTVGEAVPQFIPAVGAGFATGGASVPLSIAMFAGLSAAPVVGQQFNEAAKFYQERNDPDWRKKAETEAMAVGLITTATSAVPGAALFAKVPGGQKFLQAAAQRVLARGAMSAGAEGLQEMSEQVLTDAVAAAIRDDPVQYDMEYWSRIGLAGVAGAVLGGMAGAALHAPTPGAVQPESTLPETRSPALPNVATPSGTHPRQPEASLQSAVQPNPVQTQELPAAIASNPLASPTPQLGIPGPVEQMGRPQALTIPRVQSRPDLPETSVSPSVVPATSGESSPLSVEPTATKNRVEAASSAEAVPLGGDSSKKPWEVADENIKPYVEGLRALSDKELKAEEKRAAAELNKWANDNRAIVDDGKDYYLNPEIHSVKSFEVSARFNAVGDEIDRRKSTPPSAEAGKQPTKIEQVKAQAASRKAEKRARQQANLEKVRERVKGKKAEEPAQTISNDERHQFLKAVFGAGGKREPNFRGITEDTKAKLTAALDKVITSARSGEIDGRDAAESILKTTGTSLKHFDAGTLREDVIAETQRLIDIQRGSAKKPAPTDTSTPAAQEVAGKPREVWNLSADEVRSIHADMENLNASIDRRMREMGMAAEANDETVRAMRREESQKFVERHNITPTAMGKFHSGYSVKDHERTIKKAVERGEVQKPTAEQIIAESGNKRDALQREIDSRDEPAIWIDHQLITETGKYEYVDGKLRKVQDLNKNGFLKNLQTIEQANQESRGKWFNANKAADAISTERRVKAEQAEAREQEARQKEAERVAEIHKNDDARREQIDADLSKTKFTQQVFKKAANDEQYRVEVKGPSVGGLVVHRNGPGDWTVSHAKSGQKVIGNFDNMQQAKVAAMRISRLEDFTKDAKSLATKEIGPKMAKVLSAIRSGGVYADISHAYPDKPARPDVKGQGKLGDLIDPGLSAQAMGSMANPNFERRPDGSIVYRPKSASDLVGESKSESPQHTFEDKETEARYQQARKGVGKLPLSLKLRGFWNKLAEVTQRGSLPKLPRTKELAEARAASANYRNADTYSIIQTEDLLARTIKPLSASDYDLFTRKVILDDLTKTEGVLPFGLTKEQAEKELERVNAVDNPRVAASVEYRKKWQEAIKADYIAAHEAIGIDLSDRLNREDYFRHQVLYYMQLRQLERAGVPAKPGAGARAEAKMGRGFLKAREGSELDINANYLQAEWEVVTQMIADTRRAEMLGKIKREYDISDNPDAALPGVSYEEYQLRPGRTMFAVHTVPESIAAELMGEAGKEVGITNEDIRKAIALGAEYKPVLIPKPIAEQLTELNKRQDHSILDKAVTVPMTWWKQWVLQSPTRVLAYNLRNMTEVDKVLALNPSTMTKVPQAIKELGQLYGRSENVTAEMRQWVMRGGAQTLVRVNELGDIDRMKRFARLAERKQESIGTKAVKSPADAWRQYWDKVGLATDFREAIMRYASYLDYLEQAQAGKIKNYGAAIRSEVEGLSDPRDKAFLLSSSLLGNYSDVSVLGQWLRQRVFPFWSFKETNFRAYFHGMKNLASNEQTAVKAGLAVAKSLGVGGLARAPFMAYKLGRIAILYYGFNAALSALNRVLFPDDDDELPPTAKRTAHLTLGRNADGQVVYFQRLGTAQDFLQWFGADAPWQDFMDVMEGRRTLKDIAVDYAKSPLNQAAQGITPFIKTPAEIAAGQSYFPDATNPRRIRDRWEHIAGSLGLAEEYRALTGKPSRGYLRNLTSGPFSKVDPGSSAYYSTLDLKARFMREKLGQGQGYSEGPRSDALRNYKMAIRFDDISAARRYLAEYKALGGTKQGLKQSLTAMNPTFGLSAENRAKFIKSLRAEDREQLKKANRYYKEVLLGGQPLPD